VRVGVGVGVGVQVEVAVGDGLGVAVNVGVALGAATAAPVPPGVSKLAVGVNVSDVESFGRRIRINTPRNRPTPATMPAMAQTGR